MPNPLVWQHASSAGFSTDLDLAFALAKRGDWSGASEVDAVRAFRALLAANYTFADLFSGTVPKDGVAASDGTTKAFFPVEPPEPPSNLSVNRVELAYAPVRLLRATAARLAIAHPDWMFPTQFQTADGNPPVVPPGGAYPDYGGKPFGGGIGDGGVSTGFGWPAAVAVIVGVIAVGILADKAIEVYRYHLLQRDAAAAAINANAQAVELQKAQWDAEEKAGKPLPLSDAGIAVIRSANQLSQVAADDLKIQNQPKLPNVFPIGDIVHDVTSSAVDLGKWLAIGAGVLGLGYLVLSSK